MYSIFRSLTVMFIAASLSACSSGTSNVPPSNVADAFGAQSQSLIESFDATALPNSIFVINSANATVDAYNAIGRQLYSITGFTEPQGVATDADGSLYVADTSNSSIVVFAKPHGGTSVTLTDSGQYPVETAIAPKTALVAATNILSTSGGAGSVSFYKRGVTMPCANVANAGHFTRIYYAAFDAQENLFLDGTDMNGNAVVGEISGGCSAKTIAPLSLKAVSLNFPGSVAVNTADQIVIAGTSGIYTFAQPAGGSLGKPLATTVLSGAASPAVFVLAKNGKALWSANGSVAEYAYPAGGAPLRSFAAGGEASAIAITPAESP